ncbi:MAG: RDD family protein [Chelatococcus sp.]|uniref:RDD family protein n=1 Tax=unclassified Chelatococcus TaxID=2638111 RepID=UPI001BCF197B|nr:RDD family protein [Chelatococcus sp.]MBS7738472.1 RDD family protein [Chelatococcus sp. HY11]CAH1671523.1 putative RDD family membrane protein YckC [Hyphomicrobiales bacterium]MBX3537558.1 RDD family protein [Chelatococcus sp.]MBX3542876.1 RDD family protein [Chelatococcus sp.]MCO5076997.1 RDD family protein [Chelatococcus sp.]
MSHLPPRQAPQPMTMDDYGAIRGVITPRFFAYLIDIVVIALLMLVLFMVVAVLGVITFGLAWFLFPLIGACTGILYSAVTVSGERQSTIGMRLMGLKVIGPYGRPDFITAAIHALFFYVAASTGFLLAIDIVTAFVRSDRRMLHDVLAQLTVIRD